MPIREISRSPCHQFRRIDMSANVIADIVARLGKINANTMVAEYRSIYPHAEFDDFLAAVEVAVMQGVLVEYPEADDHYFGPPLPN